MTFAGMGEKGCKPFNRLKNKFLLKVKSYAGGGYESFFSKEFSGRRDETGSSYDFSSGNNSRRLRFNDTDSELFQFGLR